MFPSRLCYIILFLSTFLCSCANPHFRLAADAPPPAAPRAVDLQREKQVANLHFPRGLYSFYAVDDNGFYYRAPRPVLQHVSGRTVSRDGGIFVEKRNPQKLRGYIFLAGALTHVGNLSRTPHVLVN
ncbi:MAG: hypothetical protein ACJ8M1_10320 [Chthoniobacterales bacterium]